MHETTIAILGGGHMATSLVQGLISTGFKAQNIWVTDLNEEKLAQLNKVTDVNTTTNNNEAVDQAKVVILAVKPQHIKHLTQEVAASIQQHRCLVISIAAGILESSLQKWLGGNCAIVRCMPNTPALLRTGASGLYANQFVSSDEKDIAESILRAVGVVTWLENEDLMDSVTALSGSGPAYFFLLMEIMQEIAMQMGLSKDTARLLTLQTALGASRMAMESDEDVSVLRAQVTSKGGTTEKALEILEEKNIRNIFAEALKGAAARAKELAEKFKE